MVTVEEEGVGVGEEGGENSSVDNDCVNRNGTQKKQIKCKEEKEEEMIELTCGRGCCRKGLGQSASRTKIRWSCCRAARTLPEEKIRINKINERGQGGRRAGGNIANRS